jgi:hypothetical protein
VALESSSSAPPRRLGSRHVASGPVGLSQGHLLRGIAWGLLFAAPVWIALVVLALLVARAQF